MDHAANREWPSLGGGYRREQIVREPEWVRAQSDQISARLFPFAANTPSFGKAHLREGIPLFPHAYRVGFRDQPLFQGYFLGRCVELVMRKIHILAVLQSRSIV